MKQTLTLNDSPFQLAIKETHPSTLTLKLVNARGITAGTFQLHLGQHEAHISTGTDRLDLIPQPPVTLEGDPTPIGYTNDHDQAELIIRAFMASLPGARTDCLEHTLGCVRYRCGDSVLSWYRFPINLHGYVLLRGEPFSLLTAYHAGNWRRLQSREHSIPIQGCLIPASWPNQWRGHDLNSNARVLDPATVQDARNQPMHAGSLTLDNDNLTFNTGNQTFTLPWEDLR